MWIRWLVTAVAATSLAACAQDAGPPLSSLDKLFLQKVADLGGTMSGFGAQTDALVVGKDFCREMRAGSSRPDVQETLFAKYPAVSVTNILDAATAANLIYCPETLK